MFHSTSDSLVDTMASICMPTYLPTNRTNQLQGGTKEDTLRLDKSEGDSQNLEEKDPVCKVDDTNARLATARLVELLLFV